MSRRKVPQHMPDELHGLDELLDFIRAEGRFELFGQGISTYPSDPNENEQTIFLGCVELEQRGLIWRQKDTPEYVLWMPVEFDDEPA